MSTETRIEELASDLPKKNKAVTKQYINVLFSSFITLYDLSMEPSGPLSAMPVPLQIEKNKYVRNERFIQAICLTYQSPINVEHKVAWTANTRAIAADMKYIGTK